MGEVIQVVGVTLIGLVTVVTLRVAIDIMISGRSRVREIREEGGGVRQKWAGELAGGQRDSSTGRAHGLHMTVRNGVLSFNEKSVIARDLI